MDHWVIWTTDINRNYFLQMSCNSNNNDIKIMLCSPFYSFKNNFQKQANDKDPVDVMSKVGGPVKILGKNVA